MDYEWYPFEFKPKETQGADDKCKGRARVLGLQLLAYILNQLAHRAGSMVGHGLAQIKAHGGRTFEEGSKLDST